MLLDNISLGTIADTLKVSYNAVYYYKRHLDLLALIPTFAITVLTSQKQAFGLSIDKVL